MRKSNRCAASALPFLSAADRDYLCPRLRLTAALVAVIDMVFDKQGSRFGESRG
jgi:hypothetical protein